MSIAPPSHRAVRLSSPPKPSTHRSKRSMHTVYSPGTPAVVSIGGVEWSSHSPTDSTDSEHINAWANFLVSMVNETDALSGCIAELRNALTEHLKGNTVDAAKLLNDTARVAQTYNCYTDGHHCNPND